MKILLTGDDGYKSLGIRTVNRILQGKHELKIAATKEQKSAVGGGVTRGGQWGKSEVEGTEALWVSGTPADAVECAEAAFGKIFDVIISGINQGANVGNCNPSGTFGAAVRALSRNLAPKAIAFSWLLPHHFWSQDTDEHLVDESVINPGKHVEPLIKLALKHNFWGSDILNINFPEKIIHKELVFTKPLPREMATYYNFKINLNSDNTYNHTNLGHLPPPDPESDAALLEKGYVTAVAWPANLYPTEEILELQGKKIKL